jgi:diguanylate cyclase (GGDEF)-like protein/PAS domain S-box-containing protein
MKKTSTFKQLFIPIALLVAFLAAVFAYLEAVREMQSVYESAVKQAQTQVRMLTLTESLVGDKVNTSMRLLRHRAQLLGSPSINGELSFGEGNIPNLVLGNTAQINNFSLVDGVTSIAGGSATLFVKKGDDFIRVSTNIKQKDGSRAIGTKLDPNGRAIKSVRQGNAFYGVVDILDDPYITGYEPMLNKQGQVIGVWYVGFEANVQALRQTVETTQFLSSGFSAIIDNKGRIRYISDHIDKTIATNLIKLKPDNWQFVTENVPEWDFQVILAYPKIEAKSAGYAKVFYIILAATIIILVMLLIIGLRFKQLVLNPIGADLSTATSLVKRISDGDLVDDQLSAKPDTLMSDILKMRNKLSTMVSDIKHNSDRLALAASVFEHTHDGIFITDEHGAIMQVNPAFERLTGFTSEECVGQNVQNLNCISLNKKNLSKIIVDVLKHGIWHGEIENQRKNGDIYIADLEASIVRDSEKKLRHYVGIFSDITLFKNQQISLEHMAYYDSLTQLPNRVLFMERLKQTLSLVTRNNEKFATCYFDLDGFKTVNDRLGHEAGDQLLKELAQRVRLCLRSSDTFARIGGDEFALLVCGIKSEEEAFNAIERILDEIKIPFYIKDEVINISASAGLVTNLSHQVDVERVLNIADKTMYKAKVLGKDMYQVFNWSDIELNE